MFTFLNDAMFLTMRCFLILNDAIFRRCSEKKHRPRCFWRCSKKAETSCSRCILAMFLLTILNELKNCSKFFEICDKLWQQCVYSNNLLTKILAWQAILYQRGINIVGHNHFWRCGPRPKTSRKTSHFLLNDAMFQRCFEKNIDLDVFDDVWKKPKHRINDASNDVNRPPLLTAQSQSELTGTAIHYFPYSLCCDKFVLNLSAEFNNEQDQGV